MDAWPPLVLGDLVSAYPISAKTVVLDSTIVLLFKRPQASMVQRYSTPLSASTPTDLKAGAFEGEESRRRVRGIDERIDAERELHCFPGEHVQTIVIDCFDWAALSGGHTGQFW
jgi:hypothetical protein